MPFLRQQGNGEKVIWKNLKKEGAHYPFTTGGMSE
jgi:hypothetical protein